MGICASDKGASKTQDEQTNQPVAASTKDEPAATAQKEDANGNAAAAEGEAEKKEEVDLNVGNILLGVPIMKRITHQQRAQIAEALSETTYKEGDVIIKQGEPGDRFFIIKSGKAKVIVNDAKVGEVGRGDFFGEAALLNKARRNATITAMEEVVCWFLSQESFHKLLGNKVRALFPKRTAVSSGREDGKSSEVVFRPEDAKTEKGKQIQGVIRTALQKNLLFQKILGEEQIEEIVEAMWSYEIKAGGDIIKQGSRGDNFYVVESGRFDIYVAKEGEDLPGIRVAERGPFSSFGELALMYNAPRAATVKCVEDAKLWAVDRFAFKRIVTQVSKARIKEYESFLENTKHIGTLTAFERSKVAEALEEVTFEDGANIVTQGEKGDTFYILKQGTVVCTILDETKSENVIVKRYQRPGEYFGEKAIIEAEPRAATCTAQGECTCLCLKRDVFEMLLGPLEDLMKSRMAGYSSKGVEEEEKKKAAEKVVEVDTSHHTHFKGADDLVKIGILGKGSFGCVSLVEDDDKNRYALKKVNKQRVADLGQQDHMMSEKDVMLQLNHPFIVKLFQTFQDETALYFLLEPSLGGELFSVLRENSFFNENESKFFAASVTLVFEYLHSKDIIYRDLKPENLLLDERGFLKVTDFGFAKVVPDRTWTLCGTPDYLAPEVVAGRSHGKGVDWWTLGILIYEMLVSYPPFYDQEPMRIYAKIMHAKPKFAKGFNRDAQDIIKKLLHQKPTQRLGVMQGGASKIKKHPWFKGYDWDGLVNRTITAPFGDRGVSEEDPLLHFEEYGDESDSEPYNGQDNWDKFDSS